MKFNPQSEETFGNFVLFVVLVFIVQKVLYNSYENHFHASWHMEVNCGGTSGMASSL